MFDIVCEHSSYEMKAHVRCWFPWLRMSEGATFSAISIIDWIKTLCVFLSRNKILSWTISILFIFYSPVILFCQQVQLA